MTDLSKCQCSNPGWCPVFRKGMGTSPPNWQWCQDATEDEREAHLSSVGNKKNKSKRGPVDIVDFYHDPLPLKSDYAVCVIPANDLAMELLDITRKSIVSYAKECGADYIELSGDQHPDWPMANKYRLHDVTSRYEKTLYLDCDIVIKEDTPNIFLETPDDKISAHNEWKTWKDQEDTGWIQQQQEAIIHKVLTEEERDRLLDNGQFTATEMLNGGVLVIPRSLADYYSQPKVAYPRCWCFDQHILTLTVPKDKINYLSERWNNTVITSQKKETKVSAKFWKNLSDCHFIHVNGLNGGDSDNLLRKGMLKNFARGDYSHGQSSNSARFITNSDLIYDTLRIIDKLPQIRGVIGIPRSGMIPASMLAVSLSVPLYSLEMGRMVKLSAQEKFGGSRMFSHKDRLDLPFLVVDDTSYTGSAMVETRKNLTKRYPELEFIFTAIYHEPCIYFLTNDDGCDVLDIVNNELKFPHILEWNIFNAHPTQLGIFDLDGVFCLDCTPEQDADEKLYVEWIKSVAPIKERIPRIFQPMAICTARPEKYRDETESWLAKSGIGYSKLFMWEGSKEQRDKNNRHRENVAEYKADRFKSFVGDVIAPNARMFRPYKSKPLFFIESCDIQSQLISIQLSEIENSWVISINEKKVY